MLFSFQAFSHVWEIRVNQNVDGSLTWYVQSYHSVNQCNLSNSGININGTNYPLEQQFSGSVAGISNTIFGVVGNYNRGSYAVVNTPFLGNTLNVSPYSTNACWANLRGINGSGSFTPPPPPVCTSFPVTGASNSLGTPTNGGTTCDSSDDSIPVNLTVNHLACGNITGDGQFSAYLDPNGANTFLGNVNYNTGITTPLNFTLPANVNAQVLLVDNDFPSNSFTYTITGLGGSSFAGLGDTTPPIITSQDVTIQLDATGNASILSNNSNSNLFTETFSNDTPGVVSSLVNWNVAGNVDVGNYIPSNTGIEIDLAGNNNATLTSKNTFTLSPGDYEVSFDHLENNNPSGGNSVNVKIGNSFNQTFNSPSTTQRESVTFTVSNSENAVIILEQLGNNDAAGSFIGDFQLTRTINPSYLVYANATDECGIAGISVDKSTFDCSNIGDNTVTLTVTDVNGNSTSADAVVTVEDNIAPSAIAQNITVQLDENGQAIITAAELDGGSTDNCGIATIGISDFISSKIIKPTIERPRPCHENSTIKNVRLLVGCGGGYSFTSSHATNHFAIATFLGLVLLPLFRFSFPLFLAWAGSISYAQVYVGVHFPLDVISGGIVGFLIGYLFFRIYAALSEKYIPVS